MADIENRKKAIDLYMNGSSIPYIMQVLNIPKATVYRWIKEIKSETKGETRHNTFETVRKAGEENTQVSFSYHDENWYISAMETSKEIANENQNLRRNLTNLLKTYLSKFNSVAEFELVDKRLVSCLSTAIERHTNLEWRARGLDTLNLDQSMAMLTAAGYLVIDPTIPRQQKEVPSGLTDEIAAAIKTKLLGLPSDDEEYQRLCETYK